MVLLVRILDMRNFVQMYLGKHSNKIKSLKWLTVGGEVEGEVVLIDLDNGSLLCFFPIILDYSTLFQMILDYQIQQAKMAKSCKSRA